MSVTMDNFTSRIWFMYKHWLVLITAMMLRNDETINDFQSLKASKIMLRHMHV